MSSSDPVEVLLVAGGRWHDVDYARSELLTLLIGHDVVRTRVDEDFGRVDLLAESSGGADQVLITWTCDVRSTPAQAAAIADFVGRGGRWLALHGSGSVIDTPPPGGERVFHTPRVLGPLAEVLGSQFLAHPPITPFRVDVVAPAHPLLSGISPFVTTDELYVSELHEPIEVLLAAPFTGSCRGFAEGQDVDGCWPVLHLKRTGAGVTAMFGLGHCRGRFDLRDQGVDDVGVIDRIAWQTPEYRVVLRRLVAWAVHGDAWPSCGTLAA